MNAKEILEGAIRAFFEENKMATWADIPMSVYIEAMEVFARHYHRAKVEGVTDEEIYKMFPLPKSPWHAEYIVTKRQGAIELRDKLLNQ